MGKDPEARSLGLFSEPPSGPGFERLVLRRLSLALQRGNADELLAAGAIASSLVLTARDGAGAARRIARTLEALRLVSDVDLPEELWSILDEATTALSALGADAPSPARVAARMDDLWRDVASQLAPKPPDGRDSLRVAIEQCLASRLGGSVSLAELARALGYSPSHASAVIRRLTGMSFSALRHRIRLDRALWLLGRGSSIKAAAIEAGFSDPAYFSRVFRRRYGVPPSRWQRDTTVATPELPPREMLRARA